MDFQWILLALFLVAIISGVSKALSKSMLKNTLRLGAVIVAFLITFILQLCGVFQSIVRTVTDAFGLANMIPGLGGAVDLVTALISTLAGPVFFIIVFFVILWICRIIIHFVVKGIEKKQERAVEEKQEEKPAEKPAEEQDAESAEDNDAQSDADDSADADVQESKSCESADDGAEIIASTSDESVEENADEQETDGEPVAEDAPEAEAATEEAATEEAASEEAAPEAEAAPEEESAPVEEPAAAIEEKPKKKKKKKHAIYPECAWKKVISLAAGAISSILVLAVTLMPIFYLMSIVDTVTGAIEESDADDTQIYQVIDVVDEHIASPFNDSFLNRFYTSVAITDLMNYTTRAGGKITLDSGESVYADDVLKNVLSHSVSLVAQMSSAKSECPTLKADVEALVSDPMIASILADVIVNAIADMPVEEPAEDDLIGGLTYNFLSYYKDANKATIEKDIKALGGAIGVLAESGVMAEIMAGNTEFTDMLSDEETLGDVVEAISGLSAFDSTIEGAFELGIGILGDTLQIPADDSEVYDNFIDDLLVKMKKDKNVKFNMSTIRYYVVTCATGGHKVVSTNGITGHSQFIAYVNHWQKVQTAFANASEDKSYGYFTIEIDGKTYVYDETAKTIVIYSEQQTPQYKEKVSPIPGLINTLTLNSSTKQLTPAQLTMILEAYVGGNGDAASLALASRMLNRDTFTSEAVTVEKMLAATNFDAWTDETRAKDSRICVSIIMDLLGLMENLGSLDTSEGLDGASDMIDQFELLGHTMDDMKQTTCIKGLPPLLMEGIVKNEMFADFMKPSIAFQINDIVEKNDKTYADSMKQVAGILKWAINSIGGEIE